MPAQPCKDGCDGWAARSFLFANGMAALRRAYPQSMEAAQSLVDKES